MLILISSCAKPCSECKNICYYCKQLTNDTLCSTDYTNKAIFENFIKAIGEDGLKCDLIEPTISFDECDEEKVKIFNSSQYDCNEK